MMYIHFYERQRVNHLDYVVVFSEQAGHREIMGFTYVYTNEIRVQLVSWWPLDVPFQATVDRKVEASPTLDKGG